MNLGSVVDGITAVRNVIGRGLGTARRSAVGNQIERAIRSGIGTVRRSSLGRAVGSIRTRAISAVGEGIGRVRNFSRRVSRMLPEDRQHSSDESGDEDLHVSNVLNQVYQQIRYNYYDPLDEKPKDGRNIVMWSPHKPKFLIFMKVKNAYPYKAHFEWLELVPDGDYYQLNIYRKEFSGRHDRSLLPIQNLRSDGSWRYLDEIIIETGRFKRFLDSEKVMKLLHGADVKKRNRIPEELFQLLGKNSYSQERAIEEKQKQARLSLRNNGLPEDLGQTVNSYLGTTKPTRPSWIPPRMYEVD
jgi:hypothetical protein